MFERLDDIEKRFRDLTGMLSDPVVLSDQNRSREVAKERSRLEPLVLAYGEWRRVDQEMAGARELLGTSATPNSAPWPTTNSRR